jgi:predicted SprT family Zn-dependent metalloprotease
MENSMSVSRGWDAEGSELSVAPVESEPGNRNVQSNSSEENWNAHSPEIVRLSAGIMPTQETYAPLQSVYGYFNRHLCEDKLPNCLITLQRQRGSYGYFAGDRIALNPAHFRSRKIEETFSTLLHAMKHLEQHHFGKPGRGRYHNKEFAKMMRAVGLIPSDTGKEGGKETGDRISNYIEPGGRFARAVEQLLADGFDTTWREVVVTRVSSSGADRSEGGEPVWQSGRRTKFTCSRPGCKLNAWAKPGASLLCGEHQTPMEPAK